MWLLRGDAGYLIYMHTCMHIYCQRWIFYLRIVILFFIVPFSCGTYNSLHKSLFHLDSDQVHVWLLGGDGCHLRLLRRRDGGESLHRVEDHQADHVSKAAERLQVEECEWMGVVERGVEAITEKRKRKKEWSTTRRITSPSPRNA